MENKNILNSKIIFISTTVFIFSIVYLFVSIFFGYNPLNNSIKSKMNLISAFPEGWAFFTKDSKEARIYVFDCNHKIELLNYKNATFKYAFGASRHNRIANLEMSNIMRSLKVDSVKRYGIKAVTASQIPSLINADTIRFTNISIDRRCVPDFKGKYLLVVQLMLPWPLLHKKDDYPSMFIIYPIII